MVSFMLAVSLKQVRGRARTKANLCFISKIFYTYETAYCSKVDELSKGSVMTQMKVFLSVCFPPQVH